MLCKSDKPSIIIILIIIITLLFPVFDHERNGVYS